MDGASNNKGTSIDIVLATLKGSIIKQSYSLGFPTTNNEVEYNVVITGLRMAVMLGVTGLEVRCNSVLEVNQANGEYATEDEWMVTYLRFILSLKSKFPQCDFKQVTRSENNHR